MENISSSFMQPQPHEPQENDEENLPDPQENIINHRRFPFATNGVSSSSAARLIVLLAVARLAC